MFTALHLFRFLPLPPPVSPPLPLSLQSTKQQAHDISW